MRLETRGPRVRKDVHTCHTAVSNGRAPFVLSLKVCTELHMWNCSCLTLKYMSWFKFSSRFRGKKCRMYPNITDSFHSKVSLFQKYNVTAEVYENPQSANCTKAVFKGSPISLRKFRAGFLLPFSPGCWISWRRESPLRYRAMRSSTRSRLQPPIWKSGGECDLAAVGPKVHQALLCEIQSTGQPAVEWGGH